jgi:large repetitive protein
VIDDDVPDPRIEPRAASSVPAGTCSTDPSNARCSIASLAPGASAVMTVTAIALPSATPGNVANTAIVSSATPDSDPGDNTQTEVVTIDPPVSDLDVAKTADAPSPLVAGAGTVRYTIDVTNNGPSDADPVTVSDALPAGFVATSATTDRGTCTVASGGGSISCNVGRLLAPFAGDPGGTARVTIVARVPADVAPDDYSNVAAAVAPSALPTTSPPAPVTVESRANVSVAKSFPQGSDAEITPGTTETYRIRVVNDGPSVARDVVLEDLLPTGFPAGTFAPAAWRVVSVAPPGPTPTCVLGTLTCDLGDVPPGTTVELELDVAVAGSLDPDAAVTNTATITTPTSDSNPDDNTSVFTVSAEPRADWRSPRLRRPVRRSQVTRRTGRSPIGRSTSRSSTSGRRRPR